MATIKKRCSWCTADQLYIKYHDEEWGVPNHNDRHLLEMLNLEGAQAGLSWITILKKRAGYKQAFDNFDANKIARYDNTKITELLANPAIVRNKLKVKAAIDNAKAYLIVINEFGSFDKYIWSFSANKVLTRNDRKKAVKISEAMSKDLKTKGFRFVGPTICYAFMQAVGIIDDHEPPCFKAS